MDERKGDNISRYEQSQPDIKRHAYSRAGQESKKGNNGGHD